jgi:hypothetical protein
LFDNSDTSATLSLLIDISGDIEMYDNDGDNGNKQAESNEIDPSVAAAIAKATKKSDQNVGKNLYQ